MGNTRYVVEPNIKDGKGGLRDLNTLFWIGKYFYQVKTSHELVGKGVLSADEYRLFSRAEDFLWAVRCHLLFAIGRELCRKSLGTVVTTPVFAENYQKKN